MFKPMIETSAVHRKVCHFAGRVQGVGFRFTSRNIAMRHNVTGFVKNLPDGRVQLVVEGPDAEVQSCIESIKERMTDYVHHIEESDLPATGEFPNFSIRHC
jgi:acylphosphatase